MFERFTEPGIKVVVTAQEEARKIGNNFVGTEQILLGLIAETSGIGGRVLRKYGVTLRLAREEIKRLVGRGSGFVAVEIPFTPRARRVLENAIEESKSLGFPYVGPEHILLGVLMEDSGIAITALRKILREVNPDITFENIRKRTLKEMGEEFEEEFGRETYRGKQTSKNSPSKQKKLEPGNKEQKSSSEYSPADVHPYFDPDAPLLLSPVLNEYTTNITQMAFAGEIDPVIGRDTEVERVLQILSRRRKNNPILLGEPGVGKTAVAEGLALQIIGGYVPTSLQGKNIITLDLGLIIAGSRYRGDFEKRLKRVISDVQLTQCYILVIDEVHTLVGAGAAEGSLDAANILKPALARGEFQCIGATTLSEYRKYIEPDAALARRFQSVLVKEPSVDDTIQILVGIRDKYEEHHGVQITQNALEEAAVLTSRYVNDRYLPDKAIDIIDEACSRVRLGYELIPDICNQFEDHLAALCREKDAAYADKDWLTALAALREEIKFVQQFLRFVYDLIDKLKEQKKIWIIRGLQQRYQFILKGTGPLLKEWDIVLSIYDNEKLIVKLKEQQNRLDNSSLDNEIESLPKPKDSEELENQLVEYRAQLQSQPTQDFINKPPLDEEGNPMNYDSDIAKGNTDRDFDEMNPFADQELDNIQKEINNMEDLEGLDELQKKFEERTPTLPDTNISDIPSGISETVLLQNNSSDNEENVDTSENLSSKKEKETSEKTSISLKETSIGRKILKNPITQEKMIPLFSKMLDLKLCDDKLSWSSIKSIKNINYDDLISIANLSEITETAIKSSGLSLNKDEEKKLQKEFINFSKNLFEKEFYNFDTFELWNNELNSSEKQIAAIFFRMYHSQLIIRNMEKVELSSLMNWKSVENSIFKDIMEERLDNKTNKSDLTKKSKSKQTSNSKKKPQLTEEAKDFITNNPNWLTYQSKENISNPVSDFLPEDNLSSNIQVKNGLGLKGELETAEKIFSDNTSNLEEISKKILQNQSGSYTPWVFASDIAGVVSEWTGIPVSKVSKNETKKLLNIEKELQKRVIGQPEAVEAIAKALRRGRVGLRDQGRPIASFFFSGPTGVGKTEVTKALAASYFGGESDMVRFDMSEFMERHTVSKLIGSPPGYVGYNEGGQLTEAVRRKPYVVVLFDEVEKAHPDVFNLLLQVLEDGRLSDSQGRVVDFKNTIIVMTSNLGAAAIQNPNKFGNDKDGNQDKVNFNDILNEDEDFEKTEDDRVKELVHEELKGFFRPEFLNRIDEIVVFRKLTKPDIKEIASIMLDSLKERLLSKSYHLLLSDTVINKVIEEGFDPDYGARPLRRVITNRLEDNLAAIILEKDIEPGSAIWVNYKNGEYCIYHKNFDDAEDLSEFYLKTKILEENDTDENVDKNITVNV